MMFFSRKKYYVYVLNETYGCFVVKAIFKSRQQAEDYVSGYNGFVEEVHEQWEEG